MSHLYGHSSDILPNTFPPPKPRNVSHGTLSSYDKNIIMQPSVMAPIPRQGQNDEEFPTHFKPSPFQVEQQTLDTFLDPDLMVTPEKPSKSRAVSNKNFDPLNYSQEGELADEEEEKDNSMKSPKTMQKVRFDNIVGVRHMSPEITDGGEIIEIDHSCDPALELSFSQLELSKGNSGSQSEEVDTAVQHISVPSYSQVLPEVKFVSRLDTGTIIKPEQILKGQGEPHDTVLKSNLPNKSKGLKQEKHNAYPKLSSVPPVVPKSNKGKVNAKNVNDSKLVRPEFNSALQVSKELQELQTKKLDLVAAVDQKLKKSSTTKAKIEEKVSSRLNQKTQQFSDVVSLEVHQDELLNMAAQKMEAKSKPASKSKTPKPEDLLGREPDILEFFTPDLQKESPSFTLYGLKPPTAKFQTADPNSAFDVYRHIRVWERWDK